MIAADGQRWHPGFKGTERAQKRAGLRSLFLDGYSSEVAKNGKPTPMTRPRNTATPPMTAINSRRTKASSALNPMAAFFQPFHMGLPLSTPKSPPLEQKANLR